MGRQRTVAVRHPRDPNRPWVIRIENYDPATQELWEEAPPAPPVLPADFPGRAAAAAIATEPVRDLDEPPPLGPHAWPE